MRGSLPDFLLDLVVTNLMKTKFPGRVLEDRRECSLTNLYAPDLNATVRVKHDFGLAFYRARFLPAVDSCCDGEIFGRIAMNDFSLLEFLRHESPIERCL